MAGDEGDGRPGYARPRSMGARHPILYELRRWQRFRMLLLFSATIAILTSLFITLWRPAAAGAAGEFLVIATGLYSLAMSFWLRQRFSYASFDGERITVRMMFLRERLPVEDVRRLKVMRLLGAFEKPERRRYQPRPRHRWIDDDALVVRVAEERAQRVRRVLGRRAVFDDEVILPVADAAGLGADVQAALRPSPSPAHAGRRQRKRRRR
jgi:hypothetical protein